MNHLETVKSFIDVGSYVVSRFTNSQKKVENFEEMSVVIKTAYLRFDPRAKLGFKGNKVSVYPSSDLQGLYRYIANESSQDVFQLQLPLKNCIKCYPPSANPAIQKIYEFASEGLNNLRESYQPTHPIVSDAILSYKRLIDESIISKKNQNTGNEKAQEDSESKDSLYPILPAMNSQEERQILEVLDAAKKDHLINGSIQDRENIYDSIWSDRDASIVELCFILAWEKKLQGLDDTLYIKGIESLLRGKDEEYLRQVARGIPGGISCIENSGEFVPVTFKKYHEMTEMIRLGCVAFFEVGTKLMFNDHNIEVQRPNLFQGMYRSFYQTVDASKKASRNDLHEIKAIVEEAVKQKKERHFSSLDTIFKMACRGLKILEMGYRPLAPTVADSLSSYYKTVFNELIVDDQKELKKDLKFLNLPKMLSKMNIEIDMTQQRKQFWENRELEVIALCFEVASDQFAKGKNYQTYLNVINEITEYKENEFIEHLNQPTL